MRGANKDGLQHLDETPPEVVVEEVVELEEVGPVVEEEYVEGLAMVEHTGATAVGDAMDLDGPSNYVRLPDGSVVTARTTYTFRHVGEHVIVNADPDNDIETTVHVVAATD